MSIGRNATYNVVGFLVPTILGLATVPVYLHLIGPERYGVLALVWLILGYFGVSDLGLGQATAQHIASLRDATPEDRTRALSTGLVGNLAIGPITSAVLYPIAWYMFARNISLGPELRAETLRALPLLAIAPLVATTLSLLNGALMGREKFRVTNSISLTSSSLFQLLPLGVAWAFGPNLLYLIAAAIAARLVGVAMLWRACRIEFGPFGLRGWDATQMRRLLAFGGWVTFSGLLAPLLVFSDRFAIGALISAAMVTVYTVPMDAMMRISGIAVAISNALFPRLAVAGEEEARSLARMAVSAYFVLVTPLVAGLLVTMDKVMRLWLGESFDAQSAPLARLFLIAAWANCFAQVAYSRLQAKGRPDLVSKILIWQLPFYLVALWLSLKHFGLMGAAWVYLIRILADTVILFRLSIGNIPHRNLLIATTLAFCTTSILITKMAEMSLYKEFFIGFIFGFGFLLVGLFIAPTSFKNTMIDLLSRLRRKVSL